ncbi:MAG: glycosyltransferase [Kouleothrix sp.]|nr:glycosyltransferase [Kouleothrix sp.]
MHICFVSLDYPSQTGGGGVGSQVQTLAQSLARAGHRVTVIAFSETGLPQHTQDGGVNIYRVPKRNLHWYLSKVSGIGKHLALPVRELEYGWSAYDLVRRLHRSEQIDIIEGTETGAFWLAACFHKVPLVIRLHGEVYTFQKYTPGISLSPAILMSRMIQRFALRKSRLLISPSYAHAREISGELGAKRPPIEVIPNTIVLPEIDEDPKSIESVYLSRQYVLYIGRIERLKGITVLLEAASSVINIFPDIHFVLAGGKHPSLPTAELSEQVRQLDLAENVHFLGHVPHEQLPSWYQHAMIAVLPSYYETFGLAALEPMAFGVPVVTTAAGGLPEVVEHGISGILVPPGDAQALAEAIVDLVRYPDTRARLGQAARERARASFDIEQHIQRNIDTYYRSAGNDLQRLDTCEHVFFSPHCDDIVLSCGGLINSLVNRGSKTRSITVFAGQVSPIDYSAYARHLHAKWAFREEPHRQRLQEDRLALADLGVPNIEQWAFGEAPYRHDANGRPLYASYRELRGVLQPEDRSLYVSLLNQIIKRLGELKAPLVLYFPLSLGDHVDHQILFRIGIQLRALGYDVEFYEEWPYAELYSAAPYRNGWSYRQYDIAIESKGRAASRYVSQIPGLGGSTNVLVNRLARFADEVGHGRPQERYWLLSYQMAADMIELQAQSTPPFAPADRHSSIRDFGKFLRTLRWQELAEILPVGSGYCLDIGCGDGRQRSTIEQHGYTWAGLDRALKTNDALTSKADAQNLPYCSGQMAAVVAWQVMEYVGQPDKVIAEAERVLEPGGVFCGSVSFLEPVHGKTLYNISPLLLKMLLEQRGFTDIQIYPGLSSFALILWTFLRRWGKPSWGRYAMTLTALWLVPVMMVRFIFSWLSWQLGHGTGYGMRWVIDEAPLDFAGQVTFVARKPGRDTTCTSDS